MSPDSADGRRPDTAWLDQPIPALRNWGPADRTGLHPVDGGITAVDGISAGATTAGVKESGAPDLAVVVADHPMTLGAVTTQNRVKASSAVRTDRIAATGMAQAIVLNAGNANVATPNGTQHTDRMAEATAAAAGIGADDVLVMSTGVIGVPLPVDRIAGAIPDAVADATPDGGHRAATAMMTTDSHPKQVAFHVDDGNGGTCTVAGMAKGVGMIAPDMATLLVVVATDAPMPAPLARQLVRKATDVTFNRITIDGDQSTSDQCVLVSTGTAQSPPALESVARAVHAVCADLALQVIADGEGSSRVAAITVAGAATEQDATTMARAIATSLLVRAAIHGADPNWGRIMMAMGNSGVEFEPARVAITCAGHTVARFGAAASFERGQAATAMQADHIAIDIDLQAGREQATVLTCDLSEDYVRFNSEYTT